MVKDPTKFIFSPIVDKIRGKLSSRATNTLQPARAVMVKSLQVFLIPKSIIKDIESSIQNYIWRG